MPKERRGRVFALQLKITINRARKKAAVFVRISRFCLLCVVGFREKAHRPPELIKIPMPAARHKNKNTPPCASPRCPVPSRRAPRSTSGCQRPLPQCARLAACASRRPSASRAALPSAAAARASSSALDPCGANAGGKRASSAARCSSGTCAARCKGYERRETRERSNGRRRIGAAATGAG